MIKILYIPVLFFICQLSNAQNKILISGGLHTVDVSLNDSIFHNDSFSLQFESASYGFHFGGGFRINFRNIYLQPEIIFNSNSAKFKFTQSLSSSYDSLRMEKYQYLDIPLIIGLKFSILRLFIGPVAHIFIHSTSELTDISGYDDKFKTATFGYQAGIGFDYKFLSLDIRHEGNFSNYGDHIRFFGSKLRTDNKPSRLIATLSIKF